MQWGNLNFCRKVHTFLPSYHTIVVGGLRGCFFVFIVVHNVHNHFSAATESPVFGLGALLFFHGLQSSTGQSPMLNVLYFAEVLRNGVVQNTQFSSTPTIYMSQSAEVRIVTEVVGSDTWYHMYFPQIYITIKAAVQLQGMKLGAIEGSASSQVMKGS